MHSFWHQPWRSTLTCRGDGLPLSAHCPLGPLLAALLVLRLALRWQQRREQARVRVLAAVGVLLVGPRGVAHVRVGARQGPIQQLLNIVIHALVVRMTP